jgi:hypothetical protein
MNLVDAQRARLALDYLVGFTDPILSNYNCYTKDCQLMHTSSAPIKYKIQQ